MSENRQRVQAALELALSGALEALNNQNLGPGPHVCATRILLRIHPVRHVDSELGVAIEALARHLCRESTGSSDRIAIAEVLTEVAQVV